MYCKPTECHQFLHFNFAHPFHNKNSIVYSQGLRIKRLCSSPLIFQKDLENLKTWFCKRGYPQKVVDGNLKEFLKKVRMSYLKGLIGETGVPLTSFRKPFTFLYAEEKFKRVFIPAPFISFPYGYSLRKYLVRAKVYPLIRQKGTFCCGKSRCETCCKLKQTDTFESFFTKNVYKKNHSFNCDSKCLIYFFPCKVCGI